MAGFRDEARSCKTGLALHDNLAGCAITRQNRESQHGCLADRSLPRVWRRRRRSEQFVMCLYREKVYRHASRLRETSTRQGVRIAEFLVHHDMEGRWRMLPMTHFVYATAGATRPLNECYRRAARWLLRNMCLQASRKRSQSQLIERSRFHRHSGGLEEAIGIRLIGKRERMSSQPSHVW